MFLALLLSLLVGFVTCQSAWYKNIVAAGDKLQELKDASAKSLSELQTAVAPSITQLLENGAKAQEIVAASALDASRKAKKFAAPALTSILESEESTRRAFLSGVSEQSEKVRNFVTPSLTQASQDSAK